MKDRRNETNIYGEKISDVYADFKQEIVDTIKDMLLCDCMQCYFDSKSKVHSGRRGQIVAFDENNAEIRIYQSRYELRDGILVHVAETGSDFCWHSREDVLA